MFLCLHLSYCLPSSESIGYARRLSTGEWEFPTNGTNGIIQNIYMANQGSITKAAPTCIVNGSGGRIHILYIGYNSNHTEYGLRYIFSNDGVNWSSNTLISDWTSFIISGQPVYRGCSNKFATIKHGSSDNEDNIYSL